MRSTDGSSQEVSRTQVRLRRAAAFLGRIIFPQRLYDEHGGLERANGLSQENYGLLVIINHFATRDALQAILLVFGSSVLVRRPIVAPVAAHQYGRYGRLIQYLARQLGLMLMPVVTGDTVRKLGNVGQRGRGLSEYVEAASACLGSGGVVLLAPQGGRRAKLGRPRGRAVSHLLAEAQRRDIDRMACLLLGLALRGVIDYGDTSVRGFNLGRLYEVRIGRVATLGEVCREVGRLPLVDGWTFAHLSELVPESYLDSPESKREGNRSAVTGQ